MKTKAYSKEGLTNSLKLDPREKEKVETSNFISSMLEELERQVESLEAELETLQATMKKGRKDTAKQDRMSEIDTALERHKFHEGKLEIILRMLENGNIAPDSVNSIQDDIRYYVESNQDADFAEDEEIYDELNLDEDELEGDSFIRDDTPSYSLEDLASDNGSTSKDHGSHVSHPSSLHAAGLHKIDSASSNTNPAPHSSTLSRKGSTAATTLSPVISHSHLNSSPAVGSVSSSSITGMKPAPPPVRSTNELKYASAAAAGTSSSIPQGLSPLPPPSGGVASTPQSNPISTTAAAPTQTLDVPSALSPISAAPGTFAPAPVPETVKPVTQKNAFKLESQLQDSSDATHEVPASNLTEPDHSKLKKSTSNLPPGLQDLISSFDAAKRRIGTPPPIASIAKLLESSYMNCPDSFIANKPKYYQPETPFPTPSYYPQDPLAILNDALIFPRMDIDTLFYIFYYRQGTYQQSLAAKELKSRSWRFHKRFLTWFQRHEEPKVINNDFEQGTYRYFDFEGLWMQRRKSNFKFEYQFLEDEL